MIPWCPLVVYGWEGLPVTIGPVGMCKIYQGLKRPSILIECPPRQGGMDVVHQSMKCIQCPLFLNGCSEGFGDTEMAKSGLLDQGMSLILDKRQLISCWLPSDADPREHQGKGMGSRKRGSLPCRGMKWQTLAHLVLSPVGHFLRDRHIGPNLSYPLLKSGPSLG